MSIDRITKARFLATALVVVVLSAFAAKAVAAGYPDRIVRIVVPFAPGGGTDVVARALAQEMARDLGGSVIIENRPGAGTIIGTQAVATSAPDGYTLSTGMFANAVNPSLNAKLPYDAHGAFAPVALLARSFNLVVVNPATPAIRQPQPRQRSSGPSFSDFLIGIAGDGSLGRLFIEGWSRVRERAPPATGRRSADTWRCSKGHA